MAAKNHFDLEFCPVYRPTENEWRTPLKYISTLDKTTGICKIIPPVKIRSNLNLKEFKTRNQVLQELDGKSRLTNFIGISLYKFHLNYGKIFKIPAINRVNLNIKLLFELKNSTDLYYKQKCMEFSLDQSHYLSLKKLYQKWIVPFKNWVKENNLQFNLIDDSGSPVSARYGTADLDGPSIDLKMDDDDSEPAKPLRKSSRPANPPTSYKQTSSRDVHLPPKLHISKGTEICKTCSNSNANSSSNTLIICDDCEAAYHLSCLPSHSHLDIIPTHEWTCTSCILNTDIDFGFLDNSHPRTLPSFEKYAQEFKSRQFRNTKPVPSQVEEKFWSLVSTPFGNTTVEYGADLNSAAVGSGFRGFDHQSNLNRIASLEDSLLKHIKIDGVVVPWVYVGMLYSTFCWHIEDHYTYSINYNHVGDVKTWYSIPTKDSKEFERVMREENEILFKRDPDLLFHLTTMLSPGLLKRKGVDVRMCYQEAGEFVVTFPRAYHAGFNQGFNIAEAVNFATSDWLPYGKESVNLYRDFKRTPVFSHDYVIIQTVLEENVNLAVDCSLALKELRDGLEKDLRGRICIEGVYNQEQCSECKFYCFLAAVRCPVHNILCFKHECGCQDSWIQINWGLETLAVMQKRIDNLAASVTNWIKSYEMLKSPTIEEMESVIKHAEVLGYSGPELVSLQRKKQSCVDWEKQASTFMNDRKSLSDLNDFLEIGQKLCFTSFHLERLLDISRSATDYNDCILKQIITCASDTKKLASLYGDASKYQITLPCLEKVKFSLLRAGFLEKYQNVEEFGDCSWSKVEDLYQKALHFNLETLSSRLSVSIIRGQSLARRIEAYVASEQVVDFGILDTLLKEKAGIPVPDNAQTLLNWLLGAKNWCKRARHVLNPVTYEDRKTQATKAESLAREHAEYFSKLDLREANILFEELNRTEQWKENLSFLLAGQKSVSLSECFKYLNETLSFAVNSPIESPCICKSNMGYAAIQCIDCQYLYHRHCLRIPKDFDSKRFQCPVCDINLGYNPFQKPSFQSFSALVLESSQLAIYPQLGEEFQNLVVSLEKFLAAVDEAIDSCTNIWDARDLLRRLYGLFVVTNQTVRLEISLYIPKCIVCDGKKDPQFMLKCVKCNRFVHRRCANNEVVAAGPFYCYLCERKRRLPNSSLNIVLKKK